LDAAQEERDACGNRETEQGESKNLKKTSGQTKK
jgi:hypothetical protein